MRRYVALGVASIWLGCSTQPNSDAGKPDGGLDRPAPIDLGAWATLPDEDGGTKEFLLQVAKAQRGQSADFDLDGLNEVTVVHLPDGTTRWIVEGASATARAVVERYADGRTRSVIYTLGYSPPAQTTDIDTDGGRVMLFDVDHNSIFERRRLERRIDADQIEVTEQTRADGGYVNVEQFNITSSADQGATQGCKGAANIPTDNLVFGGTTGVALEVSGPAACSPDQVVKVSDALKCARRRLTDCMLENNPELANSIIAALAHQPLKIGCGNPCAGADASTEEGFWNSSARMNFNPNSLSTLTPDQLCAVMMHELGHYAGAPRDSHHDDGEDAIYNCARYCAKCVQRGPSSGPPSKDCARCASHATARRACGLDRRLEGITCPPVDICHGTIGTNKNCSTCEGVNEYDCNGKRFDGAPFLSCCMSCPADAMRLNDRPCPGPLMGSTTCAMTPAGCTR